MPSLNASITRDIIMEERRKKHRATARQNQRDLKVAYAEMDKHYLEPPKKPEKVVYAIYPHMVGSSAMYYHSDWLTYNEFIDIKNRFGDSVHILYDGRKTKT